MHTQIIEITPALARNMLLNNTDNRPLRPGHVDALRQAFVRGEHVLTHQGIAFDENGILLDGQHRLTAIALMPDGFSCRMMVTHGLSRAAAFRVVDTVQARRSIADSLGVTREVGEIGTFFARNIPKPRPMSPPTAACVEPYARFIRPEVEELIAFCGRCVRAWSSVPVRAAAVIQMKRGLGAYAMSAYRAMVNGDFESMPHSCQSLFRAHLGGRVSTASSVDLFVRCIKAFDPANSELVKVQIADPEDQLSIARAALHSVVQSPAPAKPRAEKRPAPKSHSKSMTAPMPS